MTLSIPPFIPDPRSVPSAPPKPAKPKPTPGAKFALACEGMTLRDDGTIVPHDGKSHASK